MMTAKGRILIIDYDERFSLFGLSEHYIPKALVLEEFKEAGLLSLRGF